MTTEIVSDMKVVPFFARFLDDSISSNQADESEAPEETEPTPTPFPFPYTFKFPSDFEDL